jgi:uncharacterized protein YjbJ (UPF0337 family)
MNAYRLIATIDNVSRIKTSQALRQGIIIMNGKTDIIKGRIKEAAGVLIGNDTLREKGKTDQAVGRVKVAANQTVCEAKDAANRAVSEAKNAGRRGRPEAIGRQDDFYLREILHCWFCLGRVRSPTAQ